jgi:hypothetical protein
MLVPVYRRQRNCKFIGAQLGAVHDFENINCQHQKWVIYNLKVSHRRHIYNVNTLKVRLCVQFVDTFRICQHVKLHVPNCVSSSLTAMRPKGKYGFVMLLYISRESYLNKSNTFQGLSPHKVSALVSANLRSSYDLGSINDGKNVTQTRWSTVAWYLYQFSWKSIKCFKRYWVDTHMRYDYTTGLAFP